MNKFDQYQKDVERLLEEGGNILLGIDKKFNLNKEISGNSTKLDPKKFADLHSAYEPWYSESLAVINKLLPDRAEDFKAYYKPKSVRKSITYANYTISDALRGLTIIIAGQENVGPSAAIDLMYQQFNIVRALQRRMQSTLFDIKTLVHAEVLDDELQAAEELNRKGFQRGAGAIAGVVLEAHLAVVCEGHGLSPEKKSPTLSDLYGVLKSADVIDTATWRYIQHLGDLRNKCDHKKDTDPTKDEIGELVNGVRKITKTVF
ncbi:MAG: hypothetical protein ACTS3R_17190 [Inquilinaceae bacterium]